MKDHKKFWKRERGIYRVLIVICALVLVVAIGGIYFLDKGEKIEINTDSEYTKVPDEDPNNIENGIHVLTGLVAEEGYMEVVTNCTSCHSSELIIQNRLDREGWVAAIRWMQETQNLWDLGEKEEIIINYLVTNYPAVKTGRRGNLKDVEWYELH